MMRATPLNRPTLRFTSKPFPDLFSNDELEGSSPIQFSIFSHKYTELNKYYCYGSN